MEVIQTAVEIFILPDPKVLNFNRDSIVNKCVANMWFYYLDIHLSFPYI